MIRRHLKAGKPVFHCCFVSHGQPVSVTRLVRAAGLRWPVEEDFVFGMDCFGLHQSQVHLYHAIPRHAGAAVAGSAICAVTAVFTG